MDVRHVAEAVLYMASLPFDANVRVHDRDGHQDALYRPRANCRDHGDQCIGSVPSFRMSRYSP